MRRIVKRPLARQDLIGIWRYTYEEWGEQHADRYLDELEAGIARLQDYPGLGRVRDEVRQGYRSLFDHGQRFDDKVDGDGFQGNRFRTARFSGGSGDAQGRHLPLHRGRRALADV
ncbi:type II toxin-antitoxin system RelE/ParE family toxin [Aromatoleum buckelii]|uniref:type II toxin-antitoxin system RelE/ParE family toxin n=1 Tax=Aromatoleum buckelii TaxID=200254 RepID=UPI001FF4727E|nr:type II toxin-antitoxin system RelE/ParE family toxin [Aromatoleum buckelii]MCK0509559.1 type II toxin-antitoxin system RelE/ParE family toxin [Aromatoleum buckelii]